MTAGRGIIHQEFHSNEFSKKGGEFEMCQLWVNLPRKNKMTKPHYQPIVDKMIPVVELKDATSGGAKECVGNLRVIAGSFLGTKGPATTFSPVELWDATIQKKATIDFPFPDLYNCIVFVRRGHIDIVGKNGEKVRVGSQAVALMDRKGGRVRIQSAEHDTSLLIMGGLPLNEPIAARGPFVMNTLDEINQANKDFMTGNFGR
jgi:redox-sensitive bicupin YhaK (pirin superfamily)